MAFCPEHRKWDQNVQFTPLSETTSIPTPFICGVPPPPGVRSVMFDYRTNRTTVRPTGFDWVRLIYRSVSFDWLRRVKLVSPLMPTTKFWHHLVDVFFSHSRSIFSVLHVQYMLTFRTWGHPGLRKWNSDMFIGRFIFSNFVLNHVVDRSQLP